MMTARAAEYAKAQTCVECHRELSPKSVSGWSASKHAAHSVGCADCHGSNHSTIFASQGRVSSLVCGKCHSKEHSDFEQSLHASAVDQMLADPKFGRLPPVVAELSCMGCHQVGAKFSDGSRGKCNTCHSSHTFSVEEARRPEACATCHAGPDHPHMAMWKESKHGQLFAATETRHQAPTCVTCHMPKGSHNTGIGLSFGQVSNGAVLEGTKSLVKTRTITAETARRERNSMIQTCLPCHTSRFATEHLAKADAVKIEADILLTEGVEIVQQLHDDGLLSSWNSQNTPLLNDAATGHAFVLGPEQPYDGGSEVEQRFFEMAKFHHSVAFKGAYHQSPNYTHNEGFLRLKQVLTYLKNESSRLRANTRDQGALKKELQ